MAPGRTELFVLYQMGNSEEWTWFSPTAVFLSEEALRDYALTKGVAQGQEILKPTEENEITLSEPQEFVMVRTPEGELPEVELEMAAQQEEKDGR